MKVLTWNVRGLRDSVWRSSLGRYLREWEVDCGLIQETHIGEDGQVQWKSLGQGGYADVVCLGANSRVGGLAIWWKVAKLQLLDTLKGQHIITVKFKMIQGGIEWIVTGVYVTCVADHR
jgi:exonuclease III